MKNQIKKLLIFLSAVMMLTVVMCLNVSAACSHAWEPSDWDIVINPCHEYLDYQCVYCQEIKREKNLNPVPHSISCWPIKTPTCTKEGLMQYGCLYCDGVSYTEAIPATGHTYKNDWSEILAPSCTGEGVKIRVCNECLFVNHEALAALGHSDADADEICDTCLLALSSKAETEDKNEEEKPAETPDDSTSEDITPDDITPEAPEESKKETNVFDFLIEFFNNIMDFFRKLFGIK